MITQPSILVGTAAGSVCVRVEGKGTFLNSGGLKEFSREMINRGFREFVVDLKNCPMMDSTFMGTLTAIALRLAELGQGRLRVTNVNDRNRDLLANLGLDRLFTIESSAAETAAAVPPSEQRALQVNGTDDKSALAKTMLEAHEACVEANPENAAKFKDVLEFLKHDLHLAR